MRALPALSGRAVIAALERAGFEVIRTKGSHHFLRHRDDPGRQTVVPVHRKTLATYRSLSSFPRKRRESGNLGQAKPQRLPLDPRFRGGDDKPL